MAITNLRNQLDQRAYYYGGSKDDRSPYQQTGTLVGTASVNSGYLVTDGDSDCLTYPDVASNSLFSSNQLTLFTWFNADTVDDTDQVLIGKWDAGDNNKAFKMFIDATTDVIEVKLSSDGVTDDLDLSTAETIIPATDYLVVFTWDGSIGRIYINGDEKVSAFYSDGIYNSDETIAIGADLASDVPQLFFDGTFYQSGILGILWTPQMVQNLYLLGKDHLIVDPNKELMFFENLGSGKMPGDWLINSGSFALEYDNSRSKYYLACLANGSLSIPTNDWSGSNFADSQTTIAGSPTVTRNSNNITLSMSANDGITDIVVRRN